ncbi:hypothetical protein GGI07_004217 [Coemansia sp. Benny D115]|nr:hypothetical protein GGI07_004217 [Coemansia sp. Benny D115]
MKSDHDVATGPLPAVAGASLRSFSLAIYVVAASIPFLVFIYGLVIVYLRPRVWRISIFRVLLVAQVLNCARFIVRPISIFVSIHKHFNCRLILFANNVLAILPVNLTVYCVLYLQLVVIHKVSPNKRWPRVSLLVLSVVVSVVPTFMIMVLPARVAGVEDFCELMTISSHKQYVFIITTVAIWEYLPGFIGIFSALIIFAHIVRTKRETKRAMRMSSQYYGSTIAVHLNSHPDMLQQSLRNIIWIPITPIISLWLNIVMFSVNYYTRHTYIWLEYINVCLLGLQSVLLSIALIVNPGARYVVSDCIRKRRQENEKKRRAQSHPRPNVLGHSVYDFSTPGSILSLSLSLSPSISTTTDSISDL